MCRLSLRTVTKPEKNSRPIVDFTPKAAVRARHEPHVLQAGQGGDDGGLAERGEARYAARAGLRSEFKHSERHVIQAAHRGHQGLSGIHPLDRLCRIHDLLLQRQRAEQRPTRQDQSRRDRANQLPISRANGGANGDRSSLRRRTAPATSSPSTAARGTAAHTAARPKDCGGMA